MAHRQAVQCYSRWKIQDRKHIKNTDDIKTKNNPEKANNTKHAVKQKYPGSVASYDTRPGNKVYSASTTLTSPHRAVISKRLTRLTVQCQLTCLMVN